MNAETTELTFNVFLPFIPSVGSVSGIAVDSEGCNTELSVCNSDVLLCRLCLGLWSGATALCSQSSFLRIYHFLTAFVSSLLLLYPVSFERPLFISTSLT